MSLEIVRKLFYSFQFLFQKGIIKTMFSIRENYQQHINKKNEINMKQLLNMKLKTLKLFIDVVVDDWYNKNIKL